MKTVCIYHSIDLDGWMSAAIVKLWFIMQSDNNIIININNQSGSAQGYIKDNNRLDFIGYNYGQPIPDLSEYGRVIMCDISFPKEEMVKLYEDKDFTWIDHHISAINDSKHSAIILSYDDANGIRNTKFAACELTWQYFFPNEPMPEIVRLLGRYDCFGHKFTKEDESRRLTLLEYTKSTTRIMSQEEQDELANLNIKLLEEQKILEFQYGARSVISNYEEAYIELLNCIEVEFNTRDLSWVDGASTYKIQQQGKAIYKYLCTEAKQTYKNGFEIKLIENLGFRQIEYKFIAINKERFNPINFGIDYHKEGYDGAACFHRTKDGKWAFSLYNDNGLVDCSQIAKQFGGGGHKGAAGFVLNNKDFNILIND